MTAAPAAVPAAVLPSVPPQTPGEALGLLAARRATGALHGPLGSLYLVDGRVAHADSPRAPGLADLLTGCGRITPEDWAELLRVHGPHTRVAEALVERRLLTRGELELGHLSTLFDAAFFVLADRTGGLWRFEPEARHWLGPVRAVDAERLRREAGRRGRLLERIWPWPQLDTAPVRPAAPSAQPSHRTAGRRRHELLDHADGRRTPADLARLLGRSGFGVTADIRRLAAAGLLDAPRHAAPGTAPPAEPPAAPSAAPPAEPPAAPSAAEPEAPAPVRPAGGLHRRVPGATLPGAIRTGSGAPGSTAPGPAAAARSDRPPAAAAAHPLAVPDPDIALLTRVRTLLEARL